MTIRVFVLDDHRVVRRGVAQVLSVEDDIEVVGEAATLEETLRRVPAVRPDVALLDVLLPDGDGVEACREIGARWPGVRCLIFTSSPDDAVVLDAVRAGAAGYLLKSASARDLVSGVRRVAAGEALLDPAVTGTILTRVREPAGSSETGSLTDREHKILGLLAKGLTNRQIADEVHLAEKTVKNYVSTILTKLGMRRRTEAAAYAARLARHTEGQGR